MTSPVDTSVKYFHSAMSGAPALAGEAGSLLALLDAFLVTGFDIKAPVSLAVVGGVATLIYSGGHSAEVDSVILVEGVTGALVALNGEQKVTFKSGTELKFATAAANGTAAGTVTFKMAPCGWAKVFSDTNRAAYKSQDVMSNGHFLYVDDVTPLETRVRGYETMSSISEGTGPFPTDAQLTNATNPARGGYWSKGSVANSNPVGYTFFGDSRLFMYGPMVYQSNWAGTDTASRPKYVQAQLRGFGDPISSRPSGDPYGTILGCGWGADHSSNVEGGSFSQGVGSYGALFSPRAYIGIGSSVMNDTYTHAAPGVVEVLSGLASSMYGPFPSPIDGALRLAGRYMRQRNPTQPAENCLRADLPGIIYVPHAQVYRAFPPKSRITGSGPWAGRTLVAVGTGVPSTDTFSSPDSAGISFMDITGPWRA